MCKSHQEPHDGLDLDSTEKTLEMLRSDMAALHQWMQWARAGRELQNLVFGKSEVRISYRDRRFRVLVLPGGDVSRETLHDALAAINNGEQTKMCLRCRQSKILEAFAKSASSKDGHWRYCLECERIRTKAYKKSKSITTAE